jgi:hypothetical protein
MSYALRRRALHDDMSRYICCGVRASLQPRASASAALAHALATRQGAFPCSGQCGERAAPELCLAAETVCCFPSSVAVTRFMLQDELAVRNSPTDNCLIATQFAIAQLACICSCAACITGNDVLTCA